MADKGGVIGIYFMPFIGPGTGAPTVDMLMRQIDHALKVCGADHVGIGSDLSTTPIEETPEYLREAKAFVDNARRARHLRARTRSRPLFIPELNHPRRLEGVARALAARGHSAAVIEKVIGGNFHRVLKEISEQLSDGIERPAVGAVLARVDPSYTLIRRGIADRAEHGHVGGRVERPGPSLRAGSSENRAGCCSQSRRIERGALLVLTRPRPQVADEVRRTVKIDADEGFAVHQPRALVVRRPRMRCGRCSSSSCSPTASFFTSARSASRSARLRAKRTVA